MGELPRRLVRRLPRGSKTPKSLIHIAVKEVVNSNVLLCGKLKELNRLGLFAFSVAAEAGQLNLATPTHKYAIRFSVFGSKNWEVSAFTSSVISPSTYSQHYGVELCRVEDSMWLYLLCLLILESLPTQVSLSVISF